MKKKYYQLQNGLRVLAVEDVNAKISSVNIAINVGSMDENDSNRGVSHFLEHLVFTGTPTRNEKQIDRELSMYAGHSNAYTFIDKTVYSSDTLTSDLDKTLEVLSDMIMNSTLTEAAVNKERSVIITELDMYLDDMFNSGWIAAYEEIFKGQCIASPVIGYKPIIEGISRDTIKKHYDTYYVPENTVVVIISPLDCDDIYNKVSNFMGDWKNNCIQLPKRDTLKVVEPTIKDVYIGAQNQEITFMMFTISDLTLREQILAEVILGRLGRGTTSILWRKLRNELGISYEATAGCDKFGNYYGYFMYANTSPENTDRAIEAMYESVDELINKDGMIVDLDVAKKHLLFNLADTYQKNSKLADLYTNRLLYDESFDVYDEYVKVINECSLEELIEVGRKIFKNPSVVSSKVKK